MGRFEGFVGSTYNTDLVRFADVIAPPYDVVGPPERAELAARSPYNAIRVELPLDPDGGDRYEHAAEIWAAWHAAGAVEIADSPTLYLYRMTFTEEDGSTRATTGVLGALGLDPEHTGEVLPHEQTTSKDKHDRLSLLRAARTNFSPIWGLSLAGGLGAACSALADASEPRYSAKDDDGTLHECWPVAESGAVARLSKLVASTPVLIADGHHRYETACAYYSEAAETEGADAVLALIVELSEEELAVQAINRLIAGVSEDELVAALGEWFEISPGPSSGLELRASLQAAGGLGLVLAGGRNFLLVPAPELLEAADDDLDSSRLAHSLSSLGGVEVTYQHGVAEVERAVADGAAIAAVLLRPVSVDQIARTARGGKKMPPKSTFFYPKPRTGVVFRELDA